MKTAAEMVGSKVYQSADQSIGQLAYKTADAMADLTVAWLADS